MAAAFRHEIIARLGSRDSTFFLGFMPSGIVFLAACANYLVVRGVLKQGFKGVENTVRHVDSIQWVLNLVVGLG
jgi:hypothetical protein